MFLKFLSTDLEDIFQQAGVGHDSLGLTYQDLRKVFGISTPSGPTMECFDNDRDQRYSLMELRSAVGLWALLTLAVNSIEYPTGSGGSGFLTLFCNCCTFVNWIFIILIVEKVALACPLLPLPWSISAEPQPQSIASVLTVIHTCTCM